ncbi:MAG: phosphatase PAP2 family protein [Acidimicrobiales bacterium]
MADVTEAGSAAAAPERPPPRVWREVIYIVVLYLAYSTVRNRFGSAGGAAGHANGIAYGHALDVIHLEQHLGLFIEDHVQNWYLSLPSAGFIQVWNVFYGTAHFFVTGVALVVLFVRGKQRYPVWRNTLAATTLVALVGFAAFSLMPPRLLSEPPARFGPPATSHAPAAFVDTLAKYPTFWSFDSGGLKNISNQYAAMPSLHTAWATWSALVLVPLVRRRWLKALIWLHPLATFFCIVVTANHYWLDAAFGLVALGVGYVVASRITSLWVTRARPVTASA